VWMIFCDSFKELQMGNTAALDRWFFHGHPACELVERELSGAEMAFHRMDIAHGPTAYMLRLDSGVELMFSTGTDPAMWPGCPGLFGFQLVDKRE